MYSLIVYTSLTNPYARIVRVTDGKVWDVANNELALSTTWTDTDIQLTADAVIGGIPVTIPEDLPAGEYDLLFYDATPAAAANAVSLGKRIQWTGTRLFGLPEAL